MMDDPRNKPQMGDAQKMQIMASLMRQQQGPQQTMPNPPAAPAAGMPQQHGMGAPGLQNPAGPPQGMPPQAQGQPTMGAMPPQAQGMPPGGMMPMGRKDPRFG